MFIKKHLKWIIIILRSLEETKTSIQELRNEEKILLFFKCDYYRLFKLLTAYDIISLVSINIVFFQPLLLNYTRVFIGWRKKEMDIKKSGAE